MDFDDNSNIPLLEPKRRTFVGWIRLLVVGCLRFCRSFKSELAIFAGPAVAICLWQFVKIAGDTDAKESAMLAVLSWVFIWWVAEPIPIAITALAPLFLLPFLELRTASEVSKSYMNDTVFLTIGSFILASALEHYGLHRRLALNMLLVFGGKRMDPWLLLLGFCLGTGFVSMWVLNTAAAVMMMPVGVGVLQKLETGLETRILISARVPADTEQGPAKTLEDMDYQGAAKTLENMKYQGSAKAVENMEYQGPANTLENMELASMKTQKTKLQVFKFCRAVVLAIAFAATLGGLATMTGTGVNLILAGIYQSLFPTASPITYLQWSLFGCPLALSLLLILWLLLCLWFCPRSSAKTISDALNISHVQQELATLGTMSWAELVVLGDFGVLILLWLTQSIGTDESGWGYLFNNYPGDGTVLMATLLFVIPSRRRQGEKLMDWEKCKSIPWNIVLMLGGGFALADGINSSGLSEFVSAKLEFLQSAPYLVIAPVIGLLTSIMTEFTSNDSTATMFVALVAQVATSIGRQPLYLMVPAAVGAQFSFMLPIATAPNAIAYSAGYLRTFDMLTIGLIMKVASILMLSIFMPTLGAAIFTNDC